MSIFERLKNFIFLREVKNMVVYAIVGVQDGNVQSYPVGAMPRFKKSLEEKYIKEASGSRYLNILIKDDTAIACVESCSVAAVCFLSPEIAGKHIEEIFDEDMLKLITAAGHSVFNHFPRADLIDL
ncbi:MAG TPA: hypothetical protein VFS88_03070 [Micavibrio sp.]|nr:hypothetical protein [Micavibrio sp.]